MRKLKLILVICLICLIGGCMMVINYNKIRTTNIEYYDGCNEHLIGDYKQYHYYKKIRIGKYPILIFFITKILTRGIENSYIIGVIVKHTHEA